MDRTKPYLKAAAVTSAVVLGGLFVAYHAGAFAKPASPENPPELPPAADAQTADAPPATPSDPHPAFMYGSKSAPAFLPGTPAQAPSPGTAPVPGTPNSPGQSPTFMSGSKSIIFSPAGQPPSGLIPVTPPPAPANPPPNTPKP